MRKIGLRFALAVPLLLAAAIAVRGDEAPSRISTLITPDTFCDPVLIPVTLLPPVATRWRT